MRRNQKAPPVSNTPKTSAAKRNRDIEEFFERPNEEAERSGDSNLADDEDQRSANDIPNLASDTPALRTLLADLPNKADLAQLLQDIQSSIKQEVTGLQTELAKMAGKLTALETAQSGLLDKTDHLSARATNQERQIYMLKRATEDLENRNRRCNIRIRGLSEKADLPEARHSVEGLFRQLLGLGAEEPIPIERFHRVMFGRQGKPRDLLCCLHPREAGDLTIGGDKIELYQDLAHSMIIQRRFLKEIVEALRSQKVVYRWAFPFALAARHYGTWLYLREPSDASRFCSALDIATPDLSAWAHYVYGQEDFEPDG
ncbi:hypothetical protein XELAEV_18009524mg [Xenopus laevis]|uniref:L1 transposable element RRM domain-containing protein n=1 Tax=Xenopus laevis TaxID=8355 RepID=A0A974DSQ8_XENLA|nr:hypothetical protein XELAEV_18009524mg [Xenopus laevis]